MADIAFDPFSLLDPGRERRQVEAVNGPTFNQFSALDDALMRRQVEATAGAGAIFNPFSHDPALAEQQMAAKMHGHGYKAKAVHFDGTVSIGFTDQSMMLASDAPTGLLSVWVRGSDFFDTPDTGSSGALVTDINNNARFVISGTGGGANLIQVQLENSNGTSNYTNGPIAAFSTVNWVWLGISWDVNHAIGSRVFQVFFGNNQQILGSPGEVGSAFSVNYSDAAWNFASGSISATSQITGDESDFQLWAGGSFIDLAVTANRRKFIDANDKPVNPSIAATAFGRQTILLSGDRTTFANQQGTAGATSVLDGVLTDASSSPSD